MEIQWCNGLNLSRRVTRSSEDNIIPRYVLIHIDIYRTEECAAEDGVEIDRSRSFVEPGSGQFILQRYFHSGQFLDLVDLLDRGYYFPTNSLESTFRELRRKKAGEVGLIKEDTTLYADGDTVYVAGSLTDTEREELSDLIHAT